MPMIADSLLTSIDLLIAAVPHDGANGASTAWRRIASGAQRSFEGSTAMATALVDQIGLRDRPAGRHEGRGDESSLREVTIDEGLMSAEQFDALVTPEAVTQLGRPDAAPRAGEGKSR
jgi:fumarate hydratase class II